MKRVKAIVITLLAVASLYAEPSVYTSNDFVDAGSLAQKNSRDILILKQQISQLKEKIEGLNTIIQGQNNEIAALRQKSNNNLEDIINQLSQRIATLESKQQAQVQVVQKARTQTNSESAVAEPVAKVQKKTEKKKSSIPSKKLFKTSVIDYTKKRYTKAKEGFKELLNRGYKKASVNYYLGEIAYKRGRYKEAISYFQQSATLNDSANYMDKLLLHTAKSLRKIGKGEDAKIFFKAVVDGYPGSKTAKEAKRYLK